MKVPYKIDIHHHAVPPTVAEIFAHLGNTKMGGINVPSFNPTEDIAFMDRAQIKTAIVCLSDVGDTFKEEANATRIARAANDYYAQLKQDYPGRYGAFATLPLPHVNRAKQELVYALDDLQLDGVMLLSNFEGVYLGDPKFDEIMAELDKRKSVVFVHPGKTPENSAKDALSFPEFMLEFVFDTSRAITNMIVNKIPERYPNIRFIFAHMGGTVPYLIERMTLGVVNVRHYNPNISAETQEKIDRFSTVLGRMLPMDIISERTAHVQKALKGFYFDTAVSSAAPTIQAVKDVAGLDHIVFGTDFSYAPEVVNQISQRLLEKSSLTEDEKNAVGTNALALFPQFKQLLKVERKKINMNSLTTNTLTPTEQTAFITLKAHAADAKSKHSILNDQNSLSIMKSVDFDFSKIQGSKKMDMKEQFGTVIRGKIIDGWVTNFIATNPSAVVVDLGCGLDNRSERITLPAGVDWFNVDLAGIIQLRNHFYADSSNKHNITVDVDDVTWLSQLPPNRPVIFIADGFIPFVKTDYFIKLLNAITQTCPQGEFVMNGYTRFAAKALPHVRGIKDLGVKVSPGFDDPHQIEAWAPKMHFKEQERLVDSRYIEYMPFGYRLQCKITRLPGLNKLDIGVLRYKF